MITKQILRQIPANQPFVPRMGMATGDLSYFTAPNPDVVAERALLFLDTSTRKYTCLAANEEDEVIGALKEIQVLFLDSETRQKLPMGFLKISSLSYLVDCDLLILDKNLTIQAEAVFFPSMWDPKPKINKTIEEAHAEVPGLNKNLGASIRSFLEKLPADSDTVFYRSNLGVTQTDDRNQHPGRNLPKITDVNNCFVRVEEQAFLKLRESGYTVFGIKVRSIPLQEFCGHSDAARGLYKALDTMPDDMAEYKGLLSCKNDLLVKIKGFIV